ncbi:GGDEF domain-containing protein [Iodobacter sp. HSC-16F04]|uniref:GGDEF domain-containing protein n=1 Tax=Iodobacter violaceini TaxID=3044271 RepID=A0ABX0KTK6_9NEIS|nr:GGDEF domain-containing protein [Iodobacter violacea]NHQ88015.1 GGDEF domain-containing protein [Iodobacter violacea]
MNESPCLESLKHELENIISQNQLTALFQPIASTRDGEIFGYEGLIRGPSASFLHSPINLFRVAEELGCLHALDFACRKAVIKAFVKEELSGRLFLNVIPSCLAEQDFKPGATLALLTDAGLTPQRVVIELTETQPTHDYNLLKEALLHYRNMGFKIALDDLGEGFSSLRLWSELKPEFVKIDKYFIQGLADDAQKRQFVRSIQHIALNTGTRVIAEGIESQADLQVVQKIGIGYVQGYFIARPNTHPPRQLNLNLQEKDHRPGGLKEQSAGQLLVEVPSVVPKQSGTEICRIFSKYPHIHALPVIDEGRPVGLLRRHEVIEFFGRPFANELYGNKPCKALMDCTPLIVEHSTSLQELSQLVTAADHRHLADGFIITGQGHYLGMGTGHDLMRAITELQIRAARHANPLTLLPGNVPIEEQIEVLLTEQRNFTAAYIDLDHFKPYNDVYGYACGDRMIRMLGELLLSVADPQMDFVGHIGGDDFMILFRSEDWKQRCQNLLKEFELKVQSLFKPEHQLQNGYSSTDRRGELQHFPLSSLSIGVIEAHTGVYLTHHEVAAAATHAKHLAKSKMGNSLFVEQRRLAQQEALLA